jgi:hypothetical protein
VTLNARTVEPQLGQAVLCSTAILGASLSGFPHSPHFVDLDSAGIFDSK